MKKLTRGFTLIELLVVVGVISILAIAALIAINPLESQRRSRDAARLKDMATLSSALEAFINDNGFATLVNANSQGAGEVRYQSCSANWLGINLCPYLKSVPADPSNHGSDERSVITDAVAGRGNALTVYALSVENASQTYELCTWLEADVNRKLILNDNGTSIKFETGTNLNTPAAGGC